MARISELYPSKYLGQAHLHGRDVTAVIDRVVVQDLRGGQRKPIVYFRGGALKPWPLNKTCASAIANDCGYGDDTDKWPGKPITLYPTMTEFQGQPRACIRVRPANGAAKEEPFNDPIPDLAPPADESSRWDELS